VSTVQTILTPRQYRIAVITTGEGELVGHRGGF